MLVRKILRFHSEMHISAEGMPELMEAPAPKNRDSGTVRLIPIDLTKASRKRT